MKKKLSLIIMVSGLAVVGFSMHYGYGNIFKKIAKGVKKGVQSVSKGVKKGVQVVKKGVQEVGKVAEKVGETIVKCARAAAISAEMSAKETAYRTALGALEVAKGAVKTAQGSFNVATGTLEAANQTQKGLMTVADQAQKGVLRVSNELQKAGLTIAEGSVLVTSGFLDLSAEAIAKGFNIKKVSFETSFASLAGGTLPEVRVEGTVFGKDFNLRLKTDLTDMTKLAEQIINKVFPGLTKSLEDAMSFHKLIIR